VPIPPYHPDTPEVRLDWAQNYDNIETMDGMVGKVLGQLREDGLDDSTIVFFYSDHGSGMPRSKRWPFNSGLHVPMVVHIPDRFKHLAPPDYKVGGATDRLVSFVDLAPTVLSLAGIAPAPLHQGHAFLGPRAAAEQPFIYGFRGRMDERYDMVRSVRDKRYSYLRHYMPDRIYGQHVSYMFETPTTAQWRKLFDEGKLSDVQAAFWREKPAEELFDLEADPYETRNLANSPEHKATLARLRKAQQDLARKIRDVGFLPEEEIHTRSAGSTPHEMGHDSSKYPFERVMAAAEAASSRRDSDLAACARNLSDTDSAVRYWGAMGMRMRGPKAVDRHRAALRGLLADASESVRVVAAEALGRFGNDDDLAKALPVLLEAANVDRHSPFVAMLALNAIDHMDKRAASAKQAIAALPRDNSKVDQRMKGKIDNLIQATLAAL
jgi:uncharacterized sulfatase